MKNPASITPAMISTGQFRVAGCLVEHNSKEDTFAEVTGYFWWKRIRVTKYWFSLPWQQQMGILWHEAGHWRLWHKEKRLLLLFVGWTRFALRTIHRHELEADQFAKKAGFGLDLAEVIARFDRDEDRVYYPSIKERLMALLPSEQT